MAVTLQSYNNFKLRLGEGLFNLSTNELRAVPLLNTYTFAASHVFISSLTNEVTTNGGTRVQLSTVTWALSGNNALLDSDDIPWTASGGSLTIRKVAIVNYSTGTTDADRELLFLLTADADLTAGAGAQIKITTPGGLIQIT